jgi:hypothetical protein
MGAGKGKYGLRTEELDKKARTLRDDLPTFLSEQQEELDLLRLSGTRLPDDGEIDEQFKKSYEKFAGVIDERLKELQKAITTMADLARGTVRQNEETEELNTAAAQNFRGRAGGTH